MAKGKAHRPSPIEIDGDTARIILNRGGVALIDAADVPLVAHLAWRRHVTGTGGIYVTSKVLGADEKRHTVYLHRHIMGNPPGLTIDHRDNDGLNNRRANLRECTQSKNSQNRRTVAGRPLKGVYRNEGGKSWYMKIGANGVRHRSGPFSTPELAAAEYDRLALELHGAFARAITDGISNGYQ